MHTRTVYLGPTACHFIALHIPTSDCYCCRGQFHLLHDMTALSAGNYSISVLFCFLLSQVAKRSLFLVQQELAPCADSPHCHSACCST